MMEYKGYLGKVEFDDEQEIFSGEIIGLRDVVTFQGKSVEELHQAFKDSVDDYLEFCKERGEKPEKPFSGRFITRIEPDLHRRIDMLARASKKSLNAWIADQLRMAVAQEKSSRNPTRRQKAKRPPRRIGH
jgi:predicted HicB family RNase H-like nuclease